MDLYPTGYGGGFFGESWSYPVYPPPSYQTYPSPPPYYQTQPPIHHSYSFTSPDPPPFYPPDPISQPKPYHYQQAHVVSEDYVNSAHVQHVFQIHREATNAMWNEFQRSLEAALQASLDKAFDKAFASFTSASSELGAKLKHQFAPRAQVELPSGIKSVASHLDARSESSPTGSLTMARPEKVPIDPTVSDVASSSLSPLSCRSTTYRYPPSAMSFLKAQRPRACFKRYRVKNKRHRRQNKTAYYADNRITSLVDSGEVKDLTDRVLATLKMKLLSANACLDDAEGKADVKLREMSVSAVGRLAQDSHHQGVFKDQTTAKFSDVEESVDGVQSSVTAILEELKSMRAEARAVHISFGSVTAPLGTSALALEASESSTRATTTSTAVVSPDAQEILPRTSDYPFNLGDNDVLLGFVSEVDTDVINNTSSVQATGVISVNGSRVNKLDKGKGIDGGGEAVVSAMQDGGVRKKVKEMGMMSRKAVEDEGSSSVSQTVSLSDNTLNQITKLLLNSRIVSLPWNCACQRVSGVIVDRNVNELEVLGLKGQRLVFEVLADDSRLVDDSVETYNDSCQRKGSVYVCELFDKMTEAEKSEALVKLGLLWEPKVVNSLINLGGKSGCLEAVCPDDSTVLFYDLLGTNGNASRVGFGWPRGKGSNTKGRLEVMGTKSYELDSSDPFWAANSSLEVKPSDWGSMKFGLNKEDVGSVDRFIVKSDQADEGNATSELKVSNQFILISDMLENDPEGKVHVDVIIVGGLSLVNGSTVAEEARFSSKRLADEDNWSKSGCTDMSIWDKGAESNVATTGEKDQSSSMGISEQGTDQSPDSLVGNVELLIPNGVSNIARFLETKLQNGNTCCVSVEKKRMESTLQHYAFLARAVYSFLREHLKTTNLFLVSVAETQLSLVRAVKHTKMPMMLVVSPEFNYLNEILLEAILCGYFWNEAHMKPVAVDDMGVVIGTFQVVFMRMNIGVLANEFCDFFPKSNSRLWLERLRNKRHMYMKVYEMLKAKAYCNDSLRQITKDARFISRPLFSHILSLLLKLTVEDQGRHLLVKVSDQVLYKWDEMVRAYVHKCLAVVKVILVKEDSCYACAEMRENISNIVRADTSSFILNGLVQLENEHSKGSTAMPFGLILNCLSVTEITHLGSDGFDKSYYLKIGSRRAVEDEIIIWKGILLSDKQVVVGPFAGTEKKQFAAWSTNKKQTSVYADKLKTTFEDHDQLGINYGLQCLAVIEHKSKLGGEISECFLPGLLLQYLYWKR